MNGFLIQNTFRLLFLVLAEARRPAGPFFRFFALHKVSRMFSQKPAGRPAGRGTDLTFPSSFTFWPKPAGRPDSVFSVSCPRVFLEGVHQSRVACLMARLGLQTRRAHAGTQGTWVPGVPRIGRTRPEYSPEVWPGSPGRQNPAGVFARGLAREPGPAEPGRSIRPGSGPGAVARKGHTARICC
jgi:hypothetical protein